MKSAASTMVTPSAPASGWRIRRYPVTPRMIALSKYKKTPCQVNAQNALTSQSTALMARTQPSARIEKVVAVCALPTQATPRIISRMPMARNQPQDFLTCSRPAETRSLIVDIGFLLILLRHCRHSVFTGSAVRFSKRSVQEDLRRILGNNKRRTRLWVRVEFSEDSRVLPEVLLQRFHPILVAGVIRQELRHLSHLGVVEILEQPNQSPWVVSGSCTHVGSGKVGAGFHISRVAEGMKFAKQKDRQHVRPRRTQKNGGPYFPLLKSLFLLHQGHGVMMNRVRDLVAQRSSKLVRIFHEIQERIDDIYVAARSREGVRLLFVNQVELKWM